MLDEVERLKYQLAIEIEAKAKILSLLRDAQAEVYRLRAKRPKFEEPKKDLPHGHSRYANGCRCVVCKDAAREYQALYRERMRSK